MTEVDVVIIGDGPAGSSLALACTARELDVLLVGDDSPWDATYGAWVDELAAIDALSGQSVVLGDPSDVIVRTERRHDLDRAYAFLDNVRLRDVLRHRVRHVDARVAAVDTGEHRHVVRLDSGDSITGRLVIDAAGWPASFADKTTRDVLPAWQTAFGVVLSEPPFGDLGEPTLMDFRAPPRVATAPKRAILASTFVYSLPVHDGWLVEETVLAARPAVEPIALVPRLAARLGMTPDDMLDRAVRTEYVRIPMGGPLPRRDQPVVGFGAAAGYVHPTSGYSVVHAMRMAPQVAAAIDAALAATPTASVAASTPVWNSVWPVAHRRTRMLHDYGLDMMMRLDDQALLQFFAAFFELPTATWAAYMRSDTSPKELSAVMTRLFSAAPWSTRRRLVQGNPAGLARVLRPD